MRILIRFSADDEMSSLETSKYLANLKKSLRIAKISHTNNLLDRCTIAHFISPIEEKQINDAYLEDLKVVISVGYCEGDEKHRFFQYKNYERPTLTSKSKRILKQADLILVPTSIIKDYLIEDGVEGNIEIVTGGVDTNLYQNLDEISKNSFVKYFQHKAIRPYVIAHGHAEQKALESIKKISNGLPAIDFYYLVDDENLGNSISIAKKNNKYLSKNLCISHLIPFDIYVSGMKGALAYLSLPVPTGDYLATLEAMASNTQVIYMDEVKKHGIFVNGNNVLTAANEEKAQRLIWSLSIGTKKTTITNAYDFALKNSVISMGENLKEIYKSLEK